MVSGLDGLQLLTIFIFEAENVGDRMCLLPFQVSPSSNTSPRGAFNVTLVAEFYCHNVLLMDHAYSTQRWLY